MKAREVLRLYATGKRDFCHSDLRGQNFKRENLSYADFSHSDIRGANFSQAVLKGANFTGVKANLTKRSILISLIILLIISFMSILLSVDFCAFPLASAFTNDILSEYTPLPGLILLISFIALMIFLTFPGRALAFSGKSFILGRTLNYQARPIWIIVAFLLMGLGGFIGGYMLLPQIFFLVVLWGYVHIIYSALLTLGLVVLFGAFGYVLSTVIIIALGNLFLLSQVNLEVGFIPITIAVLSFTFASALGIFIGRLALTDNPDCAAILTFACPIFAIGGTNFYCANLTDANFARVKLGGVDFRKAIITRVSWSNVRGINYTRLGGSYLKSKPIRQLLITGNGQDQNFDELGLEGTNLQNANLQDASFIKTNLNGTNLQGANLSRAKLKQTQLDRADLTGATLTGAYIEDWGITSETIFDRVRCEYVYMRVPTKEEPDPWRKPDNRQEVFEDGDFGDFIKPIVKTLDLYHNQGVDPRAIAISFKKLAENNPDAELEIVAMERRGDDKLLLRAKTAETASKSQLSDEYFETYNRVRALAREEVEALLAEKNQRINSLETMVTTALKRPSFYAEGDTNMNDKHTQQTGNFGVGINQGTIASGAKVAGIINEAQQQTLTDAAAQIQQLLEQLSQTSPTTTNKEKMVVVTEAVDLIESNPTLKAKVINALRTGGTEALKEAIDHPLVNILLAAIEGWQEAQ